MVPQRPVARDRAAPPAVDELSRVSVHDRGPESADQAVDVSMGHAVPVGQQRRSHRELLYQQRERRTAQKAVREPEALDRFLIRRRAEALASADTRTLKRALYDEMKI